MSKFNTVTESMMKTFNKENHIAYRMDWKSKLMTQVLTSFFNESKFYGDNSKEIENLLGSGITDDPGFVANLAIFARREFNMRSISHVIVCYLAKYPQGKPYVKPVLKEIIMRGDDATEILAFYLNTFGKPIPNSLRKGLREVFPTFDAYTLAKYKGDGHSVKMRDILCLCRPSPRDEAQSEIWKKLLEGKLESAYTWETELSKKGNNKETWEELIASGKVGYMALLRNLRNIINALPDNVDDVIEHIADPEAVRKSKQLPFRYISAYRSVNSIQGKWPVRRRCLEKLEEAADISVENLPKIPGKTVIAIDTSGSMASAISCRSDIRCVNIAVLLGVIANRICEDALVYTFDDQLDKLHISSRDGILKTVMQFNPHGGGTNMYLPFIHILKNKIYADRVIILSDNECNYAMQTDERSFYNWYSNRYDSKPVQVYVNQYRREVNPNLYVHAIDMMGYGTQQFIGSKTNIIAGWSEKIFEFIDIAEKGLDSMIGRIANYRVWRF